MARPGLMLYFDMLEPLRDLPLEDIGRITLAMLEYGMDGAAPDFGGNLPLKLTWGFIKPRLDRDGEAYENTKVQRKYAAFCKKRSNMNLPKIPFEEWLEMTEDERQRLITEINEPQRPVDFVDPRYPTTNTTRTTTGTTTTPPSTNTKTATSTAAAANTATGADALAAAAADRKLKRMNGELGQGVVNLSEYHIDLLLDKLGIEMFDYYVAKLANFIIHEGATVRNHYQTILKWFTEDSSC